MPLIAMPALTCGCDSAIDVRCPPADHPDTTMPLPSPPSAGNCPARKSMPAWISATICIERRIRRQRVADQRDIDAMRHRPFGEQREILLGPRLPIAAMDEQQRRRLVARLEKIDPVALARAIAEIEMVGMALAHLGRAPLPAGDDLGAAGHRHAVVEAEVALCLAHACASPARRTASSCQISVHRSVRFHFAGKCSTAP